MKYTVSLLLLVAIGHAAEPSRSKQDEDDNKAAKRELLEGNYGLRIQPSVLENDIQSKEPENFQSQDNSPPKVSQQEYPPPPVKISDVLTGEGPSFPAAIAGHLYSPVSVYQPRLGSPTTFEIARPIPSQLGYSEQKIFNDNFLQDFQQNRDFESLKQQQPQSFTNFQQHDYERQISKNTNQNFNPVPFNSGQPLINTQGQSYEIQENLQQSFEPQINSHVLNQNAEATKHSNAEQAQQNEQLQNFEPAKLSQSEQQQQQSLQQNLCASTELRPSRPDIIEPLPRLETFQPQTRPIYSEQIIQQIFPQVEELPSDFFQQINQLGNQLAYTEETVQYIQNPVDEQANREVEKNENEKSEQQNDESRQQTSTERQAIASQEQSSTAAPNQITKPQATSYARFSQGLQLPSNQMQDPPQPILLQPLPSPSPLPQFLQLTQPQPPQLFQPVPQLPLVQPIQQTTPQPQLQPLSLQPLFQPLPPQTTVKPLIPAATLQPLFTVSNRSPQRLGIIRIRQGTNQQLQNQPTLTTPPQNQTPLTTHPQNEQAISNRQPQVFTSPNSQPTFTSQELNDNEASTVSTTFAHRSTSEYSSQSTKSSTTVSIVPKAKTRPTVPPSPNSPPQVLFSPTLAPPTLPPQLVTEAPLSTVLTSIQPHSTLAPVTQPQPTLAPLQTSEPQLIQLSTQPQILSTLHPVQVSTSLQPLPTQQPFPVTQQSLATLQPIPVTQQQQETPGIRAIPVQRFQIQSEPLIQVQRIEQQQPLLGQIQPALPIQIQLQPTPSPLSQELQNQFQPQSQQQNQFKSQAEQQQQSQSQFARQQKSQFQTEKQQKAQTDHQQHPQTVQSQQYKEAATVHAHELLYDLYSSYLQPVYSEAQEILIQEPHFKAASLAFPSSYSPSFTTFQATPAFSSTQYFGKYAQDIFGGPLSHHDHYKKK